jgi:hypothetical protein
LVVEAVMTGGGGGDFGGEPGESPELEEHTSTSTRRCTSTETLSHQQHKKVVESLNFKY